MKFSNIYSLYKWKPIRNCPGRYLLERESRDSFNEVYLKLQNIREYRVQSADDTVLVCSFDDGGLISFQHDDGFVVHTLNTAEGFKRKLKQLGIGD